MKDFWFKHKKAIIEIVVWGLAAIVFIFAIPIVINWVYKFPASSPIFAMDWEAKDVLSFYGSLLGAAATIFVLTETINFTRENQKEERKLSIKPYLETQKYNYTDFDNLPDDKNIIYMEIKPNIISSQAGIPEEIRDIIESNSRKIFDQDYSMNVKNYFDEHYLLYYEISNCGAGNAINVVMKINNEPVGQSFCITTASPKRFMFILNRALLEEFKKSEYKFVLCFEYSDIASIANYSQTETIMFFNRNSLITYQNDSGMLSKPKEIEVKIKG